MGSTARVEAPIFKNRVNFELSQTTHSFSNNPTKKIVHLLAASPYTHMKHTKNNAERSYSEQNLPQVYRKLISKMKIKLRNLASCLMTYL